MKEYKMKPTRRQTLVMMAGTAMAGMMAGPALAGNKTIVQVSMWDRGEDSMSSFDMTKPIMLGTKGAAYKDSAPMGFTANKYVIPAGDVEFVTTNTSSTIEHEMLVIPIKDVTKPLPYNKDDARLDEDAAHSLGEVSETKPGGTGRVTLTLKPGTYMLTCNIAGHYAMGMWTLITVV